MSRERWLRRDSFSDRPLHAAQRTRKQWRRLRSNNRNWRIHPWLAIALVLLPVASLGLYEIRTSKLQSILWTAIDARLSFALDRGPSSTIVFPSTGPFNVMRGYARIPTFIRQAVNAGYRVVEQARLSPALRRLELWRIEPPYREPAMAGLVIRGKDGAILYKESSREHAFKTYDEIPQLVVKALLLVENRDLDNSNIPTRNPVVDWGRLIKAGFLYAGNKAGLPFHVEGGSTLATQMEKFRYGTGGRTNSVADKLRQMIGASLRAYQSGPDTRVERQSIVLDYLNSMPLAAADGYGEVNGLGNGLDVWFGIDPEHARSVLNGTLPDPNRQRIFKDILALICAVRAPTYYLKQDHAALEARVNFYVRQLQGSGAISNDFARGLESTSLDFPARASSPQSVPFIQQKAANALRSHLTAILGVDDLYTLDRLHLDVGTTLDTGLQIQVLSFLEKLKDPAVIDSDGLRQDQLLSQGDPGRITYSFTLFERTPQGNALRIQADTLNQPFDLNEGMKLELGSTAKLRTLAHYLGVIATLYREFHGGATSTLAPGAADTAKDPITRWVAETLNSNPGMDLEMILDQALDRQYSGNPNEVFFTGGGEHIFANFDRKEDAGVYSVREGFEQSVNLAFIRLLRDLVQYHEARLPYDMNAVLTQPGSPDRSRLLREIADDESKSDLYKAYQKYRGIPPQDLLNQILGNRNESAARLAIVYLAWNPNADTIGLANWLTIHGFSESQNETNRLFKAYNPSGLNIADYGYLLNRHPLEVWCAGQLMKNPNLSWTDLLNVSGTARSVSSLWLFNTRNRHAQDLRLRIRFEQDAFARMTPEWQKLGFPFDHLVPSLATAIGSSADRPAALAQLMGIILNDGVLQPTLRIRELRFAGGTPYETALDPNQAAGMPVMDSVVAHILKRVLAGVVQNGTAARLAGAFIDPDGTPIAVGGKTGSGDNRFETFAPGGGLKSSRSVSRTGTFVFYIGTQYFGVITAYVGGNQADRYAFTSALPVTILKLLAPTLTSSLHLKDVQERPTISRQN